MSADDRHISLRQPEQLGQEPQMLQKMRAGDIDLVLSLVRRFRLPPATCGSGKCPPELALFGYSCWALEKT